MDPIRDAWKVFFHVDGPSRPDAGAPTATAAGGGAVSRRAPATPVTRRLAPPPGVQWAAAVTDGATPTPVGGLPLIRAAEDTPIRDPGSGAHPPRPDG
jgi:hypothetical protein